MATITNSDISERICKIQQGDLRQLAAQKQPKLLKTPGHQDGGDDISIRQYHSDLGHVFPSSRQITFSLLLSSWESSRNPFFHAACVYLPAHEELYITSSPLTPASSSQNPVILISKVQLTRNVETGTIKSVAWQKLRPPPNMPMPAGGTRYGEDSILFCSQGSAAPGTGGLYCMPRGRRPEPVVTNFFGRDFNSVHDVVVSQDGAVWFTDPCDGFERDLRPRPQLPCHVYRYVPETGDLRVMADGLARPHAIATSRDEETVYVTDTDAVRADGEQDLIRPATIYAFDVIKRAGSPFLANKRVFAYSLAGVPRAIICGSTTDNVYAACGGGVEIWNKGGMLLGVIEVPGGVTSLSFGKAGELFLGSDQRLWCIRQPGIEESDGPGGF
ncbi:D-lactonohydrolase-like protein-like protein [Apodospora peruviana]|uniref:D-lactonohydrolase-like protein-like protein n=1 Tax=Apodospora peruviana TaxID=516989 RepID=A0AAE0I5Y3_9PEZI|nr:D-lactonohydrolase-like protein-like protein [Apodospora peruviana]